MRHPPLPALSDDAIRIALIPFGVSLSPGQASQVRDYTQLLIKWNQQLSLTTIVDPVEMISRHFGESMFAARLEDLRNGRLADLGTGAGFPGLALKIFRPNLQVILIESNRKKCAFLAEVLRALGLNGVAIRNGRYEELDFQPGFADFVAARAIGGFRTLLSFAQRALAPQGRVILWVGFDDSVKLSNSPGWIWMPPAHIPESRRRFVMIGRQNLSA